MITAFKVTLAYIVVLASMFIPCFGIAEALFLHNPLYLIPLIVGTILLIFVVHSPILKYIERVQSRLFDL